MVADVSKLEFGSLAIPVANIRVRPHMSNGDRLSLPIVKMSGRCTHSELVLVERVKPVSAFGNIDFNDSFDAF